MLRISYVSDGVSVFFLPLGLLQALPPERTPFSPCNQSLLPLNTPVGDAPRFRSSLNHYLHFDYPCSTTGFRVWDWVRDLTKLSC